MRPRLWLIGGFLTLGVLAIAIVMAPSAPYRFLGSHKPVELRLEGKEQQIMRRMMGGDFRLYTFKADYLQLFREADKELAKEGFAHQLIGGPDEEHLYTRGDLQPGTSRAEQQIWLMKDTRFTHEYVTGNARPAQDKGWVTVILLGEGHKGIIETIREWLRL